MVDTPIGTPVTVANRDIAVSVAGDQIAGTRGGKHATFAIEGFARKAANGYYGFGTITPTQVIDAAGNAVFGTQKRLTTYSDSANSGLFNGSTLYAEDGIYMGNSGIFFIAGAAERWKIEVGAFRPAVDNTQSLGTASKRTSVIFSVTGTISTSDKRTKRDFSAIPDDVLDAWGKLEWQQYRLKEAIKKKGDDARLHTGLITQDILAALGRDTACGYGLLCLNWWDDEYEAVTETVTKKRQVWQETGKMLDTKPPQPEMVEVEEEYSETVDTGKKRLVRKADYLWQIRYDEAQAMEAAYQRREMARMADRLAKLEAV